MGDEKACDGVRTAGDVEDVVRGMIREVGIDVTLPNELGNKIHYVVRHNEVDKTVRVVVNGPTSTCDHTWTYGEFDVLADLFSMYRRFLQDEKLAGRNRTCRDGPMPELIPIDDE